MVRHGQADRLKLRCLTECLCTTVLEVYDAEEDTMILGGQSYPCLPSSLLFSQLCKIFHLVEDDGAYDGMIELYGPDECNQEAGDERTAIWLGYYVCFGV